jgi:hypothetical protein
MNNQLRKLLWVALLAVIFTVWHTNRNFRHKEREENQSQAVEKDHELDVANEELKDQGNGLRRETSQLQAKINAELNKTSWVP